VRAEVAVEETARRVRLSTFWLVPAQGCELCAVKGEDFLWRKIAVQYNLNLCFAAGQCAQYAAGFWCRYLNGEVLGNFAEEEARFGCTRITWIDKQAESKFFKLVDFAWGWVFAHDGTPLFFGDVTIIDRAINTVFLRHPLRLIVVWNETLSDYWAHH
jgi:hypothetical protein